MSMFDGILQGIGGAPDDIVKLAEKVGIDPSMTERAMAALGKSHKEDGDTVSLAADKTGLDKGTLSKLVEQIGGEDTLSKFTDAIDKDGDGIGLDDLGKAAKGFFKK